MRFRQKTSISSSKVKQGKDIILAVKIVLYSKLSSSTSSLDKYVTVGQQFFIDHTCKTTTFIDPRVPTEAPYLNPHKLCTGLYLGGARRRSHSAGEQDLAFVRVSCSFIDSSLVFILFSFASIRHRLGIIFYVFNFH